MYTKAYLYWRTVHCGYWSRQGWRSEGNFKYTEKWKAFWRYCIWSESFRVWEIKLSINPGKSRETSQYMGSEVVKEPILETERKTEMRWIWEGSQSPDHTGFCTSQLGIWTFIQSVWEEITRSNQFCCEWAGCTQWSVVIFSKALLNNVLWWSYWRWEDYETSKWLKWYPKIVNILLKNSVKTANIFCHILVWDPLVNTFCVLTHSLFT